MPGKSYQSKLEPFYDFIRECRAKRWSYTRIAKAISEQHGLKVGTNTVFSFVKIRAKGRRLHALPPREEKGRQVSPEISKQVSEFFQTTPTEDHEHKPTKPYNLGL